MISVSLLIDDYWSGGDLCVSSFLSESRRRCCEIGQVSKKILRLVEDVSGVSKGHASKASK